MNIAEAKAAYEKALNATLDAKHLFISYLNYRAAPEGIAAYHEKGYAEYRKLVIAKSKAFAKYRTALIFSAV